MKQSAALGLKQSGAPVSQKAAAVAGGGGDGNQAAVAPSETAQNAVVHNLGEMNVRHAMDSEEAHSAAGAAGVEITNEVVEVDASNKTVKTDNANYWAANQEEQKQDGEQPTTVVS